MARFTAGRVTPVMPEAFVLIRELAGEHYNVRALEEGGQCTQAVPKSRAYFPKKRCDCEAHVNDLCAACYDINANKQLWLWRPYNIHIFESLPNEQEATCQSFIKLPVGRIVQLCLNNSLVYLMHFARTL